MGSVMFRAQHARPAHVVDLDARTLSPAQVDLLHADGTLTAFVESLVGDSIEIEVVDQHQETTQADVAEWLAIRAGDVVTDRRVIALAEHSGRPHFCARSKLRFDVLPTDFERRLRAAPAGLGAALDAAGIPVERAMLWWGRSDTPHWAVERGLSKESLTRTYRFLSNGRPFALVTEWFPVQQSPATEQAQGAVE